MQAEGVEGPFHASVDLHNGRSNTVFDNPYEGASSGFDGRQAWIGDVSGQILITDSPDAQATALSEAYIARNGFFHPQEDPARFGVPIITEQQGRRIATIDVQPQNGILLHVAIDLASGLISSIVEDTPDQPQTTFFADYRPVDGLKLPFRIVTKSGDEVLDNHINHYEMLGQARDGDFAVPADNPGDAAIEGDKASSVVPFRNALGLIEVSIKINGQGPFAFILDSGASSLISPALAQRLGIHTVGAGHGGQ
jgi:hypothetical protein